jgi:hypothetical protein
VLHQRSIITRLSLLDEATILRQHLLSPTILNIELCH